MKSYTTPFFGLLFLAAIALASCGRSNSDGNTLHTAELAYANGRYATAQMICDSLVITKEFSSLSTDELCRLALLFARLSENHGDENANTAFAAKALDAALERDPDSTAVFLSKAPVEDRARLALISAIAEGHRNPVSADSLDYEASDSTVLLY